MASDEWMRVNYELEKDEERSGHGLIRGTVLAYA
jgi:hypothetical protein